MSDRGSPIKQECGKYTAHFENTKGLVLGEGNEVLLNYGTVEFHLHQAPPEILKSHSREDLLNALEAANQELRLYPHDIAGVEIERPETLEILEWIKAAPSDETLGVLLDQPGGGKTVVMRSVFEGLAAARIPALSLKADTLSGISSDAQLTDRLQLPVGVVEYARALASEALFVVVLDQLDALSLNLTRDQATLDLMLKTLAILRGIKNVRVVASCRIFDLHHDPRLSKIKVNRTFHLEPFSETQIMRVLKPLQINYDRLLPAHRKLLSVPLHLTIYARIVSSRTVGKSPESFRTLQELYEELWRLHISSAPEVTQCDKAIYKLVEVMHCNQLLTAAEGVLDEFPRAATYLQQVGFSRREDSNFLFAHQTLFDYCYARHFVASGRSISEEILAGPQGLFERSQMVQVMAYLRGANEGVYRRELPALLFSDKLRFHLRTLLLNWFGSLQSPPSFERGLALRLISTTQDRVRFLMAASGNADWFDTLGAETLQRIIRETDEQTERAVFCFLGDLMLNRAVKSIGRGRVATLQITSCSFAESAGKRHAFGRAFEQTFGDLFPLRSGFAVRR